MHPVFLLKNEVKFRSMFIDHKLQFLEYDDIVRLKILINKIRTKKGSVNWYRVNNAIAKVNLLDLKGVIHELNLIRPSSKNSKELFLKIYAEILKIFDILDERDNTNLKQFLGVM